MRLVKGNLGRATFKTSAVDAQRRTIEAPARVFADQDEVLDGVQGRRARARRRRRGPLPGPARQRHARAAQADPAARRAAGPRLQGRAGHRRADVGRVGQGAGRDPLSARRRSAAARSAGCATATSSACQRRRRAARGAGRRRRMGAARRGRAAAAAARAPGASCSPSCATAPTTAEQGASAMLAAMDAIV